MINIRYEYLKPCNYAKIIYIENTWSYNCWQIIIIITIISYLKQYNIVQIISIT